MSARVSPTGFPVWVDRYAKFSLVLGKSEDILQSDLLRGERAGDLTVLFRNRENFQRPNVVRELRRRLA